MRVHALVHGRSRVEQRVHVVRLTRLEANPVIDHLHVRRQSHRIHAHAHAGLVRISQQVLELVHVDAVLFVGDDVKQKSLLLRSFLVARDEIAHAPHDLRL